MRQTRDFVVQERLKKPQVGKSLAGNQIKSAGNVEEKNCSSNEIDRDIKIEPVQWKIYLLNHVLHWIREYVNEKYSSPCMVAIEKMNHKHTLSRAYKNISNSILSYSFQEKN